MCFCHSQHPVKSGELLLLRDWSFSTIKGAADYVSIQVRKTCKTREIFLTLSYLFIYYPRRLIFHRAR